MALKAGPAARRVLPVSRQKSGFNEKSIAILKLLKLISELGASRWIFFTG